MSGNLMTVIDLTIDLYKEGNAWFKELSTNDWRKGDIDKVFGECRRNRFTGVDDVKSTLGVYARGNMARPGKALILKAEDDVLFLLEPVFGQRADNTGPKTTFLLGVVTRIESEHKFFGYRYEGPEGGDSHNLYHAQPIQGFEKDMKVRYSADWYPSRWPTFPLCVQDDCQLLLSVVFSVQGIEKIRRRTTEPSPPKVRDSAVQLLGRLHPAIGELAVAAKSAGG
jgi:hypothetical protein